MRIALSCSRALVRAFCLLGLGLLVATPVWAATAPPEASRPSTTRPSQASSQPPRAQARPNAKPSTVQQSQPVTHARTAVTRPNATRPNMVRPNTVRSDAVRPDAARAGNVPPRTARAAPATSHTRRGHYARGVESRHPGLTEPAYDGIAPQIVHFPATAAAGMPQVLHGIDGGYCGQMLMPAAALREVSRGFRHGHAGIDLMAPHGSPIRAAAAGSVIYAGWYYAYGNIVDLRHADGVVTRYAHMSAFAPHIAAGTEVAAGEEIGHVGATGRASGAHVHFEVRLRGRAVDPRPYLALSSCDGVNAGEEILEAYADERPPVAQRRPVARPRPRQASRAPAPPVSR